MESWKEEIQRQAAREDELYRRRLAAMARRRAHRRKILSFAGVLALFIAATVTIVLATREDTGGDTQPPNDGLIAGEDPEGQTVEDGADDPNTEEPGEIEIPDWITVDLLPLNDYSRPGIELPEVNGVVVHYVGNPNTTAKQNRSYFANLAQTHETSASSHFLVGLEGEIIQCVPLNEISYCSNNRNFDTIAIEVCHPDETGKFNDETVDSLVKLLKWLCDTYDLTRDDVIRHYDVNGKICPKYYVENPEAWESLKDLVF